MLTDLKCKHAECPADKARIRFTDEGGLYPEAAPNVPPTLVLEVLFRRQREALALGSYPETSLKDARAARDEAR